jgi:small-conductance mechanosensitive channel
MRIEKTLSGSAFLVIAVSWTVGTFGASAQTTSPPTPEVRVFEPVTVTVWNRPLIVLRASIGGVSPEDRAAGIESKVEGLSLDSPSPDIRADHATLGGLTGILVTVDENIVLGILPQDLDPESRETLDDVGQETVRRLREILEARREQQRPGLMLRRTAAVLAATALLILFGFLVLRLRRVGMRLSSKWTDRSLAVHGFDLRSFVARVVKALIEALVLITMLAAVQSWLAFSLTRFPYTRPWGLGLRSFLLKILSNLALGALHAIPGLFTAAVIFVAARFTTGLLSAFFLRIERGEIETPWLQADTARATRRIAITLTWIFAIIAAYPYLPGAQTDAFKGVSVFVGLMVSLGGVGFVNQIMSGLVVVYSRTLKPGDYVRVVDKEGVVREVGALTTKIVTLTGEEVTVPNAVMVGTAVTNYSRLAGEKGAVVHTSVTIGYDTPWRQVHALLARAADRTPGVRRDSQPQVLQRALSDFYVEYELIAPIERVEDRIRVLSDLHAAIQDAFNEFGVQIMSPHFRDQPVQKIVVPESGWNAPPAGDGGTGSGPPAS